MSHTDPADVSSLSGWVNAIVRAIQAQGVAVAPLLSQAGIAPATLADPEARIPIAQTQRLWRLGVEATGDPALGLRVPAQLGSGALFAMGTLIEVAPSFEAGIETWLTFLPVVSTGITMTCRRQTDGSFVIRVAAQVEAEMPEAEDALVLGLINTLLSDKSEIIHIDEVALRRPRPADPALYQRYLRGTLQFAAPHTQVRFRRLTAADAPPKLPNPHLDQAIQTVLSGYLARQAERDFSGRVRREILLQMRDEEPSLAGVAAALGISGRTLQRRLVAQHSSYRSLVDDARRSLACQLLVSSRFTITEIALRLGFQSAGNFARVFKRWQGQSPSAYRQQAQADQ